MSVSSETLAIEYAGADTTGPFAINFPFQDEGDIKLTNWVLVGTVSSVTVGDDSTVYVIGLDVLDDDPAAGDIVRDEDANQGTVLDFVNNGDGTGDLTVSNSDRFAPIATETCFLRVDLGADDFTVTQDEDEQGGSVVTDDAIATGTILTIIRQTAITQPTEFETAGPFDSESAERALDRLCLIAQELELRLRQLENSPSDAFILVPAGATEVNGVAVFTNTAARTAATPRYVGQLGIQVDTRIRYDGTALSAGAWSEMKHRAWDHYSPLAYNVTVGDRTLLFCGTVPTSGTIREAVVAVKQTGSNSMDFVIQSLSATLATGQLPNGATSVATATSALTVSAGEQIFISTSSSYGAPDCIGLEVFLEYDRT